jgi:hypothetical protein
LLVGKNRKEVHWPDSVYIFLVYEGEKGRIKREGARTQGRMLVGPPAGCVGGARNYIKLKRLEAIGLIKFLSIPPFFLLYFIISNASF